MTTKIRPPHERFQWSIDTMRLSFRIIGQDIFRDDFRRCQTFYALTTFWSLAIGFNIVTVLDFDHCQGTMRYMCIVVIGAASQILLKFLWIPELRPLIKEIDSMKLYYQSNSRPSNKFYRICERTGRITELVVGTTLVAYALLSSLTILSGFLDGLLLDHKLPVAHFYLPCIYEYDGWLFALVTVYNIIIVIFAVILSIPVEMLFYVVTANVSIAPAIIQQDMDELSTKLNDSNVDSDAIQQTFTDYIAMHHEFNAAIRTIDGCFRRYCIAQFVGATFFTILSASLVSAGSYSFSYMALALGAIQLCTYCVLGTIIETAGSRFFDSLYSLDWHLLPVQHQVTYRFLLQHALQPQIIYLASVKPVNMETFLGTVKTIYSYGMMFAAMI